MDVNGQLHAPAALLPEHNLGIHRIGDKAGPWANQDDSEKRKTSCPCRDTNRIIQIVAESLERLHHC